MLQGLPVVNHIPNNDTHHSFRYTLNISNSLNTQNSSNERLLLDYELYNATFLYDRKLNQTWWMGVNISLLSYQAGSLDSFIDNFHDFFGFRRGGRPYYAQDQLAMQYTINGRSWINQSNQEQGFGDVTLSLSRQLNHTQKTRSGFSAYLKLPSGDPDRLTGSGAANLAAVYAVEKRLTDTFSAYYHAGGLILADGDVLPQQQKRSVIFGSALLQWQPLKKTAFKVQLDAHTPFYEESELPLLNDAILITVGGTYHLSEKTALDIAVGEDIKVNASADVNFHFALRKAY